MKAGNLVKTHRGEYGIIVKPAFLPYDWFVDIKYKVGDKTNLMREPYEEKNLTFVKEEDD